MALIMMALGLGWFGSYEWIREEIRKPFVVYDYMYANAAELPLAEAYSNGYLNHIQFRTDDDGADLFRHACRYCHTIDGYRALKPAYDGTDVEFITGTIRGIEMIEGNMPPFLGTDEEIVIIAAHIYEQIEKRPLSAVYDLEGVALGRKVYEVRCGKCHVFGGFNDKTESLVDLSDEDYHDFLDMAGDFADEMPAFTGDDLEREALILYLKSLGEGGTP